MVHILYHCQLHGFQQGLDFLILTLKLSYTVKPSSVTILWDGIIDKSSQKIKYFFFISWKTEQRETLWKKSQQCDILKGQKPISDSLTFHGQLWMWSKLIYMPFTLNEKKGSKAASLLSVGLHESISYCLIYLSYKSV